MWQAAQVWGEEEKATLRRRERQVQEAEERADTLLQSAAAQVDRQSQALEEERHALQQQQLAFEQVALLLPILLNLWTCNKQSRMKLSRLSLCVVLVRSCFRPGGRLLICVNSISPTLLLAVNTSMHMIVAGKSAWNRS